MDEKKLKIWFLTDTLLATAAGIGGAIVSYIIFTFACSLLGDMVNAFIWSGHNFIIFAACCIGFAVSWIKVFFIFYEDRLFTVYKDREAQK